MSYAVSTTVDQPYAEVVPRVRAALAEQGFGILTEIDVAATLKEKLDVEVGPWLILGACNPPLAHVALQAEPSIGLLLPCNVVVRAAEAGGTVVEAVDPQTLVSLTGNPRLQEVADEAGRRLSAALESLPSGADPGTG